MNADIHIEEQVPLAPMTTMQVGGAARYLVRIKHDTQVPTSIAWASERNLPPLVLGEGSNLVISDAGWHGVVLKMESSGIEVLSQSSTGVDIRVQAGVCWDDLVAHTVQEGWWGIENMSLIPGTVGACPVQNVGAYGQECRRVITRIKAYDTLHHQWVSLESRECKFSFRTSIFNTTDKDRYIITAVDFHLSSQPVPCLTRQAVKRQLRARYTKHIDQAAIREVIIALRTNGKLLPKPGTWGSAGTFFRASLIPYSQVPRLIWTTWRHLGWSTAISLLGCVLKYGSRAGVTVSSRLLIEACGLQGLTVGSAELFSSNPAVVATHTNPPPKATDILYLIRSVRNSVYSKTGMEVPVEPSLVGFTPQELESAFALTRVASNDGRRPGQNRV